MYRVMICCSHNQHSCVWSVNNFHFEASGRTASSPMCLVRLKIYEEILTGTTDLFYICLVFWIDLSFCPCLICFHFFSSSTYPYSTSVYWVRSLRKWCCLSKFLSCFFAEPYFCKLSDSQLRASISLWVQSRKLSDISILPFMCTHSKVLLRPRLYKTACICYSNRPVRFKLRWIRLWLSSNISVSSS